MNFSAVLPTRHGYGRSLVLITFVLLGLAPTWSWQASSANNNTSLVFALPVPVTTVSSPPLAISTAVDAPQVPVTSLPQAGGGGGGGTGQPTPQTQSLPPPAPAGRLLTSPRRTLWAQSDFDKGSTMLQEKGTAMCQKLLSLDQQDQNTGAHDSDAAQPLDSSEYSSIPSGFPTPVHIGYGWTLYCKEGTLWGMVFDPFGGGISTTLAVKDFEGGITRPWPRYVRL